ncbi:MAG: TlpA family protein disulfide reductase [Jiangellaceae bacterium]
MQLAAVGVLLAACGSAAPTAADGRSPDGVAAVDSFRLVAYQGEDLLGGREVDFESLVGNGRPVVLNFWAAQCPPCLLEMPWFDTVSQQYADRVLMLGVEIGPFVGLGTNEQGAQLLRDLDITYPAAYAVDDTPVRQFEVLSMPTTVFFDAAGEMVDNHAGILTQEQIEDRFAELAAGSST